MRAISARCAVRAAGDAKARHHTGSYTRHHTGSYTRLDTGSYTRLDTGGSNTPFNTGNGNASGIDPRSERNASRARGFRKCRSQGSCSDSQWR